MKVVARKWCKTCLTLGVQFKTQSLKDLMASLEEELKADPKTRNIPVGTWVSFTVRPGPVGLEAFGLSRRR